MYFKLSVVSLAVDTEHSYHWN